MKTEPSPAMPTVVSEKAYTFVPPRNSRFWPWFIGHILDGYLSRNYGVESWELVGKERLRASLDAGHGIMLVPNHPRPCDPMTLGLLVKTMRQPINIMASAHLFLQSSFQRWLLPRIGGFSVYREGTDRDSLRTAVDILASASRPLAVFAEGVVTRTNDRLAPLQEGIAFMARTAAKERALAVPGGQVVIHPLALRYSFHGDLDKSVGPVLGRIEQRLGWQSQAGLGISERVYRIGNALLSLKEIEYMGSASQGPPAPRILNLLEAVLVPLEKEWVAGRNESSVVTRVKNLRKAILPDLVAKAGDATERARRWKHLYDLEVAQQLFHFPPNYLRDNPTPERLIETVERYEEALGAAQTTPHRYLRLRMEIGEAITVDPKRDKTAASDPLMDAVRSSLTSMLGIPASSDILS